MGPDLPVGDGGDDVLAGLSLVLPVIPLGEVLGDLIVRESGELGGYLCTQAGRAVNPPDAGRIFQMGRVVMAASQRC